MCVCVCVCVCVCGGGGSVSTSLRIFKGGAVSVPSILNQDPRIVSILTQTLSLFTLFN